MHITQKNFKLARAWLGMTQQELADALDVTPRAIHYWEFGARKCAGPAAVLVNLLCKQSKPKPGSCRPRYKDLAPGDWQAAEGYDWCELKYDGEYGELHGGPDGWTLYSRSGQMVDRGDEPLPYCMLLVEQIRGTEWAKRYAPSEIRGKLVPWSAVNAKGQHLPKATLYEFAAHAIHAGLIELVAGTTKRRITGAARLWRDKVERGHWEGLIFRTHGSQFARMKKRVTRDYVCMGTEPGIEGVSVIGGLYNSRGKLVRKVSVPYTASDAWEHIQTEGPILTDGSHTFEASGLAILESGALRNPRFERWRPDKPAEECTT